MRTNHTCFIHLMKIIRYLQAERRVRCEIKEARVHNVYLRTCKKFDNGDVYLYEVGTSYQIGDNSGEFSREFEIKRYNTVVTEDRITVQYFSWAIWIFTSDGNNIAFYQDLFSLEDFDVSIRVCQLIHYEHSLPTAVPC